MVKGRTFRSRGLITSAASACRGGLPCCCCQDISSRFATGHQLFLAYDLYLLRYFRARVVAIDLRLALLAPLHLAAQRLDFFEDFCQFAFELR